MLLQLKYILFELKRNLNKYTNISRLTCIHKYFDILFKEIPYVLYCDIQTPHQDFVKCKYLFKNKIKLHAYVYYVHSLCIVHVQHSIAIVSRTVPWGVVWIE